MKRFENNPNAAICVRIVLGRWDRPRARLACRAMRDEVLRELSGLDEPASRIHRSAFGKPYLDGLSGLNWSASSCEHAIGIATCTEGAVGLDLESLRTELVDDRLVRCCLTTEELERWKDPIGLDPTLFLELWVRKEAALKCLGVGLHGAPNRTSVGGPGEDWARGACEDMGVFHVRSILGLTGICAGIASDRSRPVSVSVRWADYPQTITGLACAR